MSARREKGFTLIEVVVAFAVFALCSAALYETFAGAVRRGAHAREREQAMLIAQSMLSQQRQAPQPWMAERSGRLDSRWRWTINARQVESPSDNHLSWRAFEVTVSVRAEMSSAPGVVLRSVELARVAP